MIEYQTCTVTVDPGKRNEKSATYQQIVRKSLVATDLIAMLNDEKQADRVVSDWFYGRDLRDKSKVRQTLTEVPDAEKNFEKQVKIYMSQRSANGKPVTEEKAREIIKLMNEMD